MVAAIGWRPSTRSAAPPSRHRDLPGLRADAASREADPRHGEGARHYRGAGGAGRAAGGAADQAIRYGGGGSGACRLSRLRRGGIDHRRDHSGRRRLDRALSDREAIMDVDTSVTRPIQGKATQPRVAVSKTPAAGKEQRKTATPEKPVGQIVLVLQGGGALGAYQAGVCQGLMEGGIEPDWVIGTSIGAINGALITGNAPEHRLERLQEFWGRLRNRRGLDDTWSSAFFTGALANLQTITQGVAGFFQANPHAPWGIHFPVGIERAAFYTTEPLKRTPGELVDFDHLNGRRTRLTVRAVSVRSGEMRYFDSRDMALGPAHTMASGALPPGFPAVRIDGEPYWDGGIYSNTPVEVVLDDKPRRDSLIISVNMWQPNGSEPGTIWQVLGRPKA